MAKTKMHVVVVEEVVRHTMIVDARRPGGAVAKIKTDEGWRDATRYHEPRDVPLRFDPKTMTVVETRSI